MKKFCVRPSALGPCVMGSRPRRSLCPAQGGPVPVGLWETSLLSLLFVFLLCFGKGRSTARAGSKGAGRLLRNAAPSGATAGSPLLTPPFIPTLSVVVAVLCRSENTITSTPKEPLALTHHTVQLPV